MNNYWLVTIGISTLFIIINDAQVPVSTYVNVQRDISTGKVNDAEVVWLHIPPTEFFEGDNFRRFLGRKDEKRRLVPKYARHSISEDGIERKAVPSFAQIINRLKKVHAFVNLDQSSESTKALPKDMYYDRIKNMKKKKIQKIKQMYGIKPKQFSMSYNDRFNAININSNEKKTSQSKMLNKRKLNSSKSGQFNNKFIDQDN